MDFYCFLSMFYLCIISNFRNRDKLASQKEKKMLNVENSRTHPYILILYIYVQDVNLVTDLLCLST